MGSRKKKSTNSDKKVEYLTQKGKEFSKENKKKATKWEKQMFLLLRKIRQYFKFQYPIICNRNHLYILDFYIPKLNLAIECNGMFHYQKENRRYDNLRKRRLKKEGIHVVEFSNKQIESLETQQLRDFLMTFKTL